MGRLLSGLLAVLLPHTWPPMRDSIRQRSHNLLNEKQVRPRRKVRLRALWCSGGMCLRGTGLSASRPVHSKSSSLVKGCLARVWLHSLAWGQGITERQSMYAHSMWGRVLISTDMHGDVCFWVGTEKAIAKLCPTTVCLERGLIFRRVNVTALVSFCHFWHFFG